LELDSQVGIEHTRLDIKQIKWYLYTKPKQTIRAHPKVPKTNPKMELTLLSLKDPLRTAQTELITDPLAPFFATMEGKEVESPLHNNVAGFIMESQTLEGVYPNPSTLCLQFNLSFSELEVLLPKVNETLRKRGWDGLVINSATLPPVEKTSPRRQLDPIFTLAVELLTDVTDKRSKAAKLKASGISSLRFNKLLADAKHRKYWDTKLATMMSIASSSADVSLVKNVEAGDLQSIKYFNEFTGRYRETSGEVVGLITLLSRVMEVLAKHVDPAVLGLVADELDNVLEVEGKELTNGNH